MTEKTEEDEKGAPNRLIKEKSPYLLQHAYNPVDWYPWGVEAFEKAVKEDKPVFLSIGYSTCHWCHVMAHESFEDREVAKLINKVFVPIKVDREERPDVDAAYMAACQALTGSGGWPLTIIMTPEKKPFFAATYIPRESVRGRVGMLDLIPRVKELWDGQRNKAVETAEKLTSHLKRLSTTVGSDKLPGKVEVEQAFKLLDEMFDQRNGGFSRAPKFPTPHNLLFLLRYWSRGKDEKALSMVEKTLQKMSLGGIFDHVGFGFHRYSVDETWLIPHFEKMLYDQALLTMAYAWAYQATKDESFRETAEKTLTYVLRDLRSSEGGFYSAEDADSEGVEGKFYLWSEAEIRDVLSKEEADLIIKVYNIRSGGNYLDEATRERTGYNILHLSKAQAEISKDLGISLNDLKKELEGIRSKLFRARENRIRPERDEKVLTDWNGLMVAALSLSARVFGEEKYTRAAREAAEFIFENVMDSEGRLFHVYKDGEAGVNGFLDDYAYLTWGLIELYETTFEAGYLSRALELTNKMITHFWDREESGFYFTSDEAEELIVRGKEIYDGAQPSGNSVAVHNLLRLSRLTANPELEKRAVETVKAHSQTVRSSPYAYTHLMSALEYLVGPSYEIVIVGEGGKEDTRKMLKALRSEFIPNKVVLFKDASERNEEILKLAGFLKQYTTMDKKTTAYVCSNYTCKKPTTDLGEMMETLTGERL